jgi:hypothetical protein
LRLGDAVAPAILPWIRNAKREIERLTAGGHTPASRSIARPPRT